MLLNVISSWLGEWIRRDGMCLAVEVEYKILQFLDFNRKTASMTDLFSDPVANTFDLAENMFVFFVLPLLPDTLLGSFP